MPLSVLDTPPPRAAYVHVPFCRHRCGYCNFTVTAGRDDLIPAYLAALATELAQLGEPRPVDTLFLGGGTPTHLEPAALEELLRLVTRWFVPAAGAELSIEANPSDIDAPRCDVLAAHGVTRVSLGAQSFSSAKLGQLERDHSAEQIARAIDHLRQTAIGSLSLDLIFATGGETLTAWQADVEAALVLAPDHISTYGLTIERGSAFFARQLHGELALPDEDQQRLMYEWGIDRLTDAGYEHYEVSNFARPGHVCRHHEVYWSGGSYYAAGPGAARYVAGRRELNHRATTTWLQRLARGESTIEESETLDAELRAREMLVLGLRRIRGITRDELQQRTGYRLDTLAGKALGELCTHGLLVDDGERVRLTRQGLLVSDAIWPHLLG